MKVHVWIAGFVPLATALLLGAGQAKVETSRTGQTQPAAVEVKIDNFSFGPTTVTVSPGTTVTWTNRDDIPHTVVSDDKIFKSKVLDTDEKFSYTFDKPGVYVLRLRVALQAWEIHQIGPPAGANHTDTNLLGHSAPPSAFRRDIVVVADISLDLLDLYLCESRIGQHLARFLLAPHGPQSLAAVR